MKYTSKGDKTKDRMHWDKGFVYKGTKQHHPYTHYHFQWPETCRPGMFGKGNEL